MPFPYQHANGRICCSNIDCCCDACKAKLAAENTRTLRSAEDLAPPDPYAAGIAALRISDAKAAAERTQTRTLAARPAEMHLDANGIPDPYFHDLERMRSANR